MAKAKVFGECRICCEQKQLTEEHYVPRAVGGGTSVKLYTGNELIKTLNNEKTTSGNKPRGKIKQSGLSAYTLCKECNEKSGTNYDKDFATFFNGIHYKLTTHLEIPKGVKLEDFLEDKVVEIDMQIKPFNVAKRLLVSFCSVEHASLAKRHPEIRKAIQDKDYQPNTDEFALYLSLHVGNSAYYGTIAAIKEFNGQYLTQAYAGIEHDFLAMYFTSDRVTKSIGILNCTEITSWLTQFKYDELLWVKVELKFNKSLMFRFTL